MVYGVNLAENLITAQIDKVSIYNPDSDIMVKKNPCIY